LAIGAEKFKCKLYEEAVTILSSCMKTLTTTEDKLRGYEYLTYAYIMKDDTKGAVTAFNELAKLDAWFQPSPNAPEESVMRKVKEFFDRLIPRGELSGVVIDAKSGQPLEKAKVEITNVPQLTRAKALTYTNRRGEFQFRNILAEERGTTYLLNISREGYTTPTKIFKATVKKGVPQAVTFSLLPQPATVEGRVVDGSSDNKPLGGVIVSIGTVQTITAADGTYRLPKIEPGHRTIMVVMGGYKSQTKEITLEPGETEKVPDIEIYPEVHLVGKVVDAHDEKPVKEALVQVKGEGFETKTDPEGCFTLQSIPKRLLTLIITKDGYQDIVRPEEFRECSTSRCDLGELKMYRFFTLKVTAINDRTKKPIPGVAVAIEGTDKKAETEADGTTSFSKLEMGDYKVSLRRAGYEERTETVDKKKFQESHGETICHSVALSPLPVLRLRIIDSKTKQPFTDVDLSVDGKRAERASDGSYQVWDDQLSGKTPPCKVEVVVVPKDPKKFQRVATSYNLAPDKTLDDTIEMKEVPRTSTVRFSFVDVQEGEPSTLSGLVTLGNMRPEKFTGGKLEIKDIPEGEHQISVKVEEFLPLNIPEKVLVKAGEEKAIRVFMVNETILKKPVILIYADFPATIKVDNKDKGKPPILILAPESGQHVIQAFNGEIPAGYVTVPVNERDEGVVVVFPAPGEDPIVMPKRPK